MIRAYLTFCLCCSIILLSAGNIMAQRLRLSDHNFGENDENLPVDQPIDKWAAINTSYRETRPYISPSGNRLYFSRGGHPENVGKESDDMDIWVADLSTNLSTDVTNLGNVVNTKGLDALCGISNDEQHIYVFTNEKIAPIAHLEMVDGNWKVVEKFVVKDFQNRNDYLDLFYSTKEEVILMAVERSGVIGGQDLYVSLKTGDGTWGVPFSLGPGINTTSNDYAPFLAADGRSLFYCSEGLIYKGGADIYYTYRIDSTWRNWTVPINLGQQINSTKEEVYVSVTTDFKTIYFDSFSPADSNRNISKADLPDAFHPKHNSSKYPIADSNIDSPDGKEAIIEPTNTSGTLPEKKKKALFKKKNP